MKELIPKDEYGVFADAKDIARVDSLFVAEFFEKEHFHVLRDIAKITDTKSGLSEEFTASNFEPSTYKDKTGRKLPCYCMTRDGFTMLVMGYTGAKAMRFKELYIRRFNEMESFIKTLVSARQEFPLLTSNIKLLHENPKPYHFSNECDMLNRIVVGMSRDYKDPPLVNQPDYIVRRLTPTECARLQGFPDSWCSNLGTDSPTEADIAFWAEVWETHRKIMKADNLLPKVKAHLILSHDEDDGLLLSYISAAVSYAESYQHGAATNSATSQVTTVMGSAETLL